MQLTCPKCHGTMRQYERSGVNIDQCADCRGIFLDRGELERLTDAETAWHQTPQAQSYPGPAPQAPGSYPQQHQGHSSRGHGHHKKRKSFFEELFD